MTVLWPWMQLLKRFWRQDQEWEWFYTSLLKHWSIHKAISNWQVIKRPWRMRLLMKHLHWMQTFPAALLRSFCCTTRSHRAFPLLGWWPEDIHKVITGINWQKYQWLKSHTDAHTHTPIIFRLTRFFWEMKIIWLCPVLLPKIQYRSLGPPYSIMFQGYVEPSGSFCPL